MISLVAQIINVFATTLQNILLLVSFTGKLIVLAITWIASVIYSILQSIVVFFQIVYDDNVAIFSEEIPASANGIIDSAVNQYFHIQDGVVDVSNNIYVKFGAALSGIDWLIRTLFVVISDLMTLFKNTVILIGDTSWFIITFIPVHLPPLLKAVFKYIGKIIVNLIVDAYMTLLKFTNYLTEVPFQSFMGITSAIIIVRLCVHFRESILHQITMLYWSLIRNVLYLYYVIYNYFTNSDVGMITQIANGRDVGLREMHFNSEEVDDVASAAESLCVICQERQKCVLTLPCRHVCLCTDCCRRLYGYQRTCPICRTFIYHAVTVYL